MALVVGRKEWKEQLEGRITDGSPGDSLIHSSSLASVERISAQRPKFHNSASGRFSLRQSIPC